jgi:mannose/fructose/N-acetylgalactosamine-specific phosphotransferase system component IIC
VDMVIAAFGFLLLRHIKIPIIQIILIGSVLAVIRVWAGLN